MRKPCKATGCTKKTKKYANYCDACYRRLWMNDEVRIVGNRDLTKRQGEIYDYMVETLIKEQYVPGPCKIAKYFNMAPNGAYEHLIALQRKGFVEKLNTEDKSGKYRLPQVQLRASMLVSL